MTNIQVGVDRQELLAAKRYEESVVYVCGEGRPWHVRNGKLEGFSTKEFAALKLRKASKARVRRGFWGAYGDVPLVIAVSLPTGLSPLEHKERPFEYFEIIGRPVKRLCGHVSMPPADVADAPPATIMN